MSSKPSLNTERIISLVISASILGVALCVTHGSDGFIGDDAVRHATLSGGTRGEFNTTKSSDSYVAQCEFNRSCRADSGQGR